MLEKLTHPRVFLYQNDNIYLEGTNKVRWELIKRFSKFPEDLEDNSGFLRCMSPCFTYYIDVNRATNKFVIRDTITGNQIYKISKGLLSLSL